MSTTCSVTVGAQKANLPILVGQSNFRRWYKAWFIALRGAKYWPVVSDGKDKDLRPVQRKDEKYEDYLQRLENYDDRNNAAHAALLAGVSDELQEIVCSCGDQPESARVAMRILKDKYDYETTTPTLQLFKNFIQLKMDEGEPIGDLISRFETLFSHVYSRCSESSRPEATALKDFLSVEEVKVMCLFLSLPPSMENIIDNLSTKENVKFADVNKRLLDLSATK